MISNSAVPELFASWDKNKRKLLLNHKKIVLSSIQCHVRFSVYVQWFYTFLDLVHIIFYTDGNSEACVLFHSIIALINYVDIELPLNS